MAMDMGDWDHKNHCRLQQPKLNHQACRVHITGGWEHRISARDFALYEVRAIIGHRVE